MSWQTYVDSNLVGTGFVSKAGIYGLNGGGVWAASPGFTLQPAEVQELIAGYSNPDALLANGIHVNGVKYLTLQANERSIYGKKGNSGICIVKTTQALMIALYDDKIQPGACTTAVEKLADYLISVGY